MKITALKVQARNKARVNVYLDGKLGLALAAIAVARLQVGQSLSEADLARLKQADAAETVYERALKFLANRPRSEAEIRLRLTKAGAPEPLITQTLGRLRQAGLVGDTAFASYWVENRNTFRPKSRRMLRLELKRKGVTDSALEGALSAVNDDEAAYRVALARARRLQGLPAADYRRRLGEFLARRGFGYETISDVVARILREVPPANPD